MTVPRGDSVSSQCRPPIRECRSTIWWRASPRWRNGNMASCDSISSSRRTIAGSAISRRGPSSNGSQQVCIESVDLRRPGCKPFRPERGLWRRTRRSAIGQRHGCTASTASRTTLPSSSRCPVANATRVRELADHDSLDDVAAEWRSAPRRRPTSDVSGAHHPRPRQSWRCDFIARGGDRFRDPPETDNHRTHHPTSRGS